MSRQPKTSPREGELDRSCKRGVQPAVRVSDSYVAAALGEQGTLLEAG